MPGHLDNISPLLRASHDPDLSQSRVDAAGVTFQRQRIG